jgi:hypothetical protein
MGFWASGQINICRKVPLQVNFFYITTFCFAVYEPYISTVCPVVLVVTICQKLCCIHVQQCFSVLVYKVCLLSR